MTKTRASKHSDSVGHSGAQFVVLPVAHIILLGLLGCGAAPRGDPVPPGLALAASAGRPIRQPDAVVLETPPALPAPVDRSSARGVVLLREPLGVDAVVDVVRSILDAWLHESIDQLVLLLTSDAGPIEARSRGRGALVEAWRQRLHVHEYRRLAGVDVAHLERVERYAWSELAPQGARSRPPDMRPEELYVRVPLEVTRIGGERVFGDVIVLLLRRDGGRYMVTGYGELDSE